MVGQLLKTSPSLGLTRGQVAKRLGVTTTTVRQKERDGALPFTVDEDGIHRFRADDVAKVRLSPRRRGKKRVLSQGDIAAFAFARFREGACARDLVETLKITPERARELFELWMSPDLAPPAPKAARPRRVEEDL